jgi:hypothetical protein
MEVEQDQLKDLIADVLMKRAQTSDESATEPVDNSGAGTRRRARAKVPAVVKGSAKNATTKKSDAGYLRVEKNLASLGYFTASSTRRKDDKSKTVSFTRTKDGNRIEVRATIVPAVGYGHPITADQDKWLALQQIVGELLKTDGRVANPITFSSAELLKLLGQNVSGKNYQDVKDWLEVMFMTSIKSEGTIYFAGQKRTVTAMDLFRVFDRVVAYQGELPDGEKADKNYVWLSEWQLENINNNYSLPIDFQSYKQLQNFIAKALVLHLQVWLYASRSEGFFEKRYDQICEILNIVKRKARSEIVRQLQPSLDELQAQELLASWSVVKLARGEYKVVFHHGPKFFRDHQNRVGKGSAPQLEVSTPTSEATVMLEPEVAESELAVTPRGDQDLKRQQAESRPTERAVDPELLSALTRRGILEPQAIQLLQEIALDQPVLRQLEWADTQITQASGGIRNPAGFYVSLIRGNAVVPEGFETQAERDRRLAGQEAEREAQRSDQRLQEGYEAYRRDAIDRYMAEHPEEVTTLLEQGKQAYIREHPGAASWPEERVLQLVRWMIRSEVADRAGLQTFAEYCETQAVRETPSPTTSPFDQPAQLAAVPPQDESAAYESATTGAVS